MGLRSSVLYGALFMKMFILCGIPFCLFVVLAYGSSSEPRGFRLKHRAQEQNHSTQVELQRLGRESMLTTQRMLLGPGSHPPRCTTKCGHCLPCQPVHAPVSPGSNVIMEYYPEAWRCKCGDRLYTP